MPFFASHHPLHRVHTFTSRVPTPLTRSDDHVQAPIQRRQVPRQVSPYLVRFPSPSIWPAVRAGGLHVLSPVECLNPGTFCQSTCQIRTLLGRSRGINSFCAFCLLGSSCPHSHTTPPTLLPSLPDPTTCMNRRPRRRPCQYGGIPWRH
jgi:hypothetical protein